MRLPSFIKLPRNKKFNFPLRHYDPIKDDLDQRISGSKNSNKKYIKRSINSGEINTSKLQLMIAFILSFLIFGWLYIGNKIFIFIVIIPLWVLFNKFLKIR